MTGGAGCRNNRVGSAGVGVCAFHPCICAGCAGAKKWIWFDGVALSCCFNGSLAIPAIAPVVFFFSSWYWHVFFLEEPSLRVVDCWHLACQLFGLFWFFS